VLSAVSAADEPKAQKPTPAGRPIEAWVKDLGSDNPLVCEEALEVLSRHAGEARTAADTIRPLLKAPIATTRARAAIALLRIEGKSDELFKVLLEAARAPGSSVRPFLLDMLQESNLATRETAPLVVECLGESDLNLRSRATGLLRQLGTPALPALIQGLEHKQPEVVQLCLSLLGNLGPEAKEAGPAIEKCLKHPMVFIRLAAANAYYFCTKDSKPILPVLLELARGKDLAPRLQAFGILLQLRPIPREAVPLLEAALEEGDMGQRVRAAEALFALDGRTRTTLPVLLTALKNASVGPRGAARFALVKMKSEAKQIVPAVVEIAKKNTTTPALHSDIAIILASMGDEALGPLEKLLTDPEPRLRQMAGSALADMGDKGGELLARALPKADRETQRVICLALHRYQGKADILAPALIALLKDNDPALREAAVGVLQLVGPRAAAAAKPAVELVLDPKTPVVLRRRLENLLSSIGPGAKDAAPDLIKVLADDKKDEFSRLQAASTLGSIGPAARDALPTLVELSKKAKPALRIRALESIWGIDPLHESILPTVADLAKDPDTRSAWPQPTLTQIVGSFGEDAKALVPVLVAQLKDSPSPGIKQQCVVALGRIGPAAKEAISSLKPFLNDTNPGLVLEAARALVLLGDTSKEIAPAVARGFKGRSGAVVVATSDVLIQLGPHAASAAEPLLEAWRKETVTTQRLRLAELLALVDPKAAAETASFLREQTRQPYSGARAAVALWRIDPKTADGLPYLLRQLREQAPYVKTYAADALGEIGPAAKEAIPDLEAALEQKIEPATSELLKARLRLATARALLRIDPKKPEKPVAALLAVAAMDDPQLSYYRIQAIEELGKHDTTAASAVPKLVELYGKSNVTIRRAIFDAVRKIDRKAVAKLSGS
jgi:HEAT repeat protein